MLALSCIPVHIPYGNLIFFIIPALELYDKSEFAFSETSLLCRNTDVLSTFRASEGKQRLCVFVLVFAFVCVFACLSVCLRVLVSLYLHCM